MHLAELVDGDLRVELRRLEIGAEVRGVETKKAFAHLDNELTQHMDVHREIEKDIEALKRRPARTAARAPRRPRTR